MRAFVQAIIRYINTGKSADVRFGSTDKVELVDINRATLEFSYKDNNGYHFMDPETYDTITLQDVFLFQQEGFEGDKIIGRMQPTGVRPKFYDRLKASGITLPTQMFQTVVEIT